MAQQKGTKVGQLILASTGFLMCFVMWFATAAFSVSIMKDYGLEKAQLAVLASSAMWLQPFFRQIAFIYKLMFIGSRIVPPGNGGNPLFGEVVANLLINKGAWNAECGTGAVFMPAEAEGDRARCRGIHIGIDIFHPSGIRPPPPDAVNGKPINAQEVISHNHGRNA